MQATLIGLGLFLTVGGVLGWEVWRVRRCPEWRGHASLRNLAGQVKGRTGCHACGRKWGDCRRMHDYLTAKVQREQVMAVCESCGKVFRVPE